MGQSESPSESTSPRCEVESNVSTTPGDVSSVAEYDVGNLLDLHVDFGTAFPERLLSGAKYFITELFKSFTQLHPRRMKLSFMLTDFLSIELIII